MATLDDRKREIVADLSLKVLVNIKGTLVDLSYIKVKCSDCGGLVDFAYATITVFDNGETEICCEIC